MPPVRKFIKNKKGSAILIVSGISLAIGIGVMALQNYLPTLTQQSLRSSDLIQYRLALESAVDYAAIAIKKRWCLTEDMDRDEVCTINNPRNTQRLLLSSKSSDYIKALPSKAGVPASSTHPAIPPFVAFAANEDPVISLINTEVTASSVISTRHPLKPIFDNLPDNVEKIKWTIERVQNILVPTTTDQTFVKIRAELVINSEGNSLRSIIRSKPLYSEALFTFYLRELSSLALVVANDLHLNKNSVGGLHTQANAGNAYIPYHSSKSSSGEGVLFKSPVFINGNIHLIPSPSSESDESYANITFADRVYLGNGGLIKDGLPFQPKVDRSGRLSTFSSLTSMGGFLGGIVIDGSRDKGLDYFVNNLLPGDDPAISPDIAGMQACIDRTKKLSNLTETKESSLIIKTSTPTDPSPNKREYKFRVGLSHGNEFLPQNGGTLTASLGVSSGNWKSPSTSGTPAPHYNNGTSTMFPVAKTSLTLDDPTKAPAQDPSFSSEMTLDSTVVAAPDVTDALNDALTVATGNLATAVGAYGGTSATLQSQLTAAPGQTSGLLSTRGSTESAFTAVKSLAQGNPRIEPGMNCGSVNVSPSSSDPAADAITLNTACTNYVSAAAAYSRNQDIITNHPAKITELQNLEAKKNAANTALTSVTVDGKQPEVQLRIEAAIVDGNPQPNQFDLVLTTTHEGALPSPLTIGILGYDVGTDLNGNNTRTQSSDSSLDNHNDGRSFVGEIILENSGAGTAFTVKDYVPGTWKIGDQNPLGLSIVEGIGDFTDYSEAARDCNSLGGTGGAAFGIPDWDQGFARTTRKSWIFAKPVPTGINETLWWDPSLQPPTQLNLLDVDRFSSATKTERDKKFHVRSIVDHCIIDENQNFIAGFVMCDRLEIKTRTTPLKIIGSFIVGHLTIHPNAVKAGVQFYSIYHPEAIQLLRQKNVLYPGYPPSAGPPPPLENGSACDFPDQPIWHPNPALEDLAKTFQCTPLSLRFKGDNWKWTQVDPEQGFPVDPVTGVASGSPKAKPIPKRFLLKEVSRESNL